MNETQEQLEKSIKLAKYRLKQFTKESLISDEVNIAYNKLLIEKAVMTKELDDLKTNKLHNFMKKIIRKISGKTLICDRF